MQMTALYRSTVTDTVTIIIITIIIVIIFLLVIFILHQYTYPDF